MRYLYCMSLWASFFTQKNYLKINRMSRINTASNEIVIESSIWIGDIIYAATYTRKPSQSWFIQPLRHSSHRLYLNCTVEHYHKNFLKNFFYSTSSICANCRLGYGLYNSFVQGFFFFFLFFFLALGTYSKQRRVIVGASHNFDLNAGSQMSLAWRNSLDGEIFGGMDEWTNEQIEMNMKRIKIMCHDYPYSDKWFDRWEQGAMQYGFLELKSSPAHGDDIGRSWTREYSS